MENTTVDLTLEQRIQSLIDYGKKNVDGFDENSLNDGYHSFDELYEFRKMYNAALFNEWAKNYDGDYSGLNKSNFPNYSKIGCHYNVHKSKLHNDGNIPFNNPKWFIVSAMLPSGLISNHYKMKDWDLFKVPEVPKALFEFDGHTGKDVLERLKALSI